MKNLMNSIDKINTVAGLSDRILSGWRPAENVQTPEPLWGFPIRAIIACPSGTKLGPVSRVFLGMKF